MDLYGFESFENWYINNKDKVNLDAVENKFDLSAIPERRKNPNTLAFRVPPNSLLDCVGHLINVDEEFNDSCRGIRVKSSETYLPSILVRLRENGMEIVKIFTSDENHQEQINSINKKLKEKEKFAPIIILV